MEFTSSSSASASVSEPPTSTSSLDPTTPEGEEATPSAPKQRLTDVIIDNEITALNIMVQFLGLAQKRGAFTIDEAAKIWECVKKFQRADVTGSV
jgi:hypothetical protein